jgi:aldehyde dehydrogenase (NAD+)
MESLLQENTEPIRIHVSNSALIEQLYLAQKDFFASGVTRSFAFRKGQLSVLQAAIKRWEPAIMEALLQDLHKSPFESYGTEIGVVLAEISYALKHLRQWMQPERASTPILFFPSSSKIYKDPLGTVLVIGPWNYPFMLLLAPVVSAIAGGNTIVMKPSEVATATEKVILKMIGETFEEQYIAAVSGPGETLGDIIGKHRFDHIFFTGSTAVGKKIMAKAAEQLTPVTLELGGKSPCIVAPDARLGYTARKIAWSKWMNAGQTCVAPDYVLVPSALKDKLVEKIAAETDKMFGKDARRHVDFPRIISQKRFRTCAQYLEEGKLLYGGETDAAALYIAPTVIEPYRMDTTVMQEEIFSPILPIVTYESREEALEIIRSHPQPLSLSIYTESQSTADFYIHQLSYGGGCINNGLIHLGIPSLPFGGVGMSGMGQYHGKFGFDSFTRKKSMVKTPSWFDVPFWYAPHKNYLKWLKKLMR